MSMCERLSFIQVFTIDPDRKIPASLRAEVKAEHSCPSTHCVGNVFEWLARLYIQPLPMTDLYQGGLRIDGRSGDIGA